MGRNVLETCRAELQRQLDELMAGAEKTVSDMTSVAEENFPDPTDRALLESNRNFTLRLRDRDRKLLVKIQEAIKRIENGMFGVCDGCGGAIEEKRRPGYARVDLHGRYLWNTGSTDAAQVALTGKVQNVLNRSYEERKGYPAPGINFLLGAELTI